MQVEGADICCGYADLLDGPSSDGLGADGHRADGHRADGLTTNWLRHERLNKSWAKN